MTTVSPADQLQARAGSLLSPLVEVQVKDDCSLGFEYGGALCSLRAMNLSDDLDVVSMICVLAWDLSAGPALHERIGACNDSLQFGTITVMERGDQADVLLRYTFPAGELTDRALATMLFLILSGAETSRRSLISA